MADVRDAREVERSETGLETLPPGVPRECRAKPRIVHTDGRDRGLDVYTFGASRTTAEPIETTSSRVAYKENPVEFLENDGFRPPVYTN